LEKRAAAPDLWDDQESAQAVMRELASLNTEIDQYESLYQRAVDARDLVEMGA
jgi:peptide chain release factor 2